MELSRLSRTQVRSMAPEVLPVGAKRRELWRMQPMQLPAQGPLRLSYERAESTTHPSVSNLKMAVGSNP